MTRRIAVIDIRISIYPCVEMTVGSYEYKRWVVLGINLKEKYDVSYDQIRYTARRSTKQC